MTSSIKTFLAVVAISVFIPATAWSMPWSWDLFTQPSHKGLEEKALAMPEGTVPVKGSPVEIGSMAEAENVKNPVRATKASIERGRDRYKIYCAVCHGRTGKGDGVVGRKYVPPTDLTSGYVQNKEAGQIYYAITYGGLGIMPKYADAMTPEDRWHIANYILNEIRNEKE